MSEPTCKVCHRPTGDTAWLCTPHTDELEQLLAELPALLTDVATTTARQDRISPTSSPRRRPVDTEGDWRDDPHMNDRPDLGVKVQALPMHVDAAALGRKILTEVDTWCRHLAEARGWTLTVRPTPQGLTRWLLTVMSSVRLDEACGELFADARAWRSACRAVVDSREDRLYVGQCRAAADDWCCARELWSPVGADEIVCDGWGTTSGDGCFAVHTAGQRHAMLRAGFDEAAVSWDEAVQAIPGLFPGEMPPPVLLRLWKSRGLTGRSEPAAVRDDGGDIVYRHGEPLFRGGDILAAVEQWRTLGAKAGRGKRNDLRGKPRRVA